MSTKGPSNLYGRGLNGKPSSTIMYQFAVDFLQGDLPKHFRIHGIKEMKYTSLADYVTDAINLANDVDRENNLSFTNSKGLTFKYSTKTNLLVLVTKEGYIVTYFKINRKRWDVLRRKK